MRHHSKAKVCLKKPLTLSNHGMNMAIPTRLAAAQMARWLFAGSRCVARFGQVRSSGRRIHRTLPGVVTTILVIMGLAFTPGYVLASHCPDPLATAELVRHADLGAETVSDHGHSHEDGDSDERGPGHVHGHDPADHSHQLTFTAPASVPPLQVTGQGWQLPGQSALLGEPDSGLERPPRSVLPT